MEISEGGLRMGRFKYTSDHNVFIYTEVERLRKEGYTIQDACDVVFRAFTQKWPMYKGNMRTILSKYNLLKSKRKAPIRGKVNGFIVLEKKGEKWAQIFPNLDEAFKAVTGALSNYNFYEAQTIRIKTKTVYAIERDNNEG
jgi:hypothetical protein